MYLAPKARTHTGWSRGNVEVTPSARMVLYIHRSFLSNVIFLFSLLNMENAARE
jgi:hypothetical protein